MPSQDELLIRPRYRNLRTQYSPRGKRPSFTSRLTRAYLGKGGAGGASTVRQGCTLKGRIGRGGGAGRAHLAYIQRSGAGLDGDRPTLFGNTTTEEFSKGKQIRLVISPENYEGVDFEKLANQTISFIQTEYGLSLRWVGAAHWNTLHPHLHLVIDTEGLEGRRVFIPKNFFKKEGREFLKDYLTMTLGPKRRMPGVPLNQITRAAPIPLDNNLSKYFRKGTAKMVSFHSKIIFGDRNALACLRRIEYLKSVGLAKIEKSGSIQLEDGWMETLNSARRYDTFLEASQKLKRTSRAFFEIYEPRHGLVEGEITRVGGRVDEISDARFLVVETADGRGFFVVVNSPGAFMQGQNISVRTEIGKTGRPIVVVESARENRLGNDR